MNLTKLYSMQHDLMQVIKNNPFLYQKEDRYPNIIAALLVEIGECMNEWRVFKDWSRDRSPRTRKVIRHKDGRTECVNPLLIEYVDGLHFVLEIGLYLEITPSEVPDPIRYDDTIEQFIQIFIAAGKVREPVLAIADYTRLLRLYLGLGLKLGFTLDRIEDAYMEKNRINVQRQAEGY